MKKKKADAFISLSWDDLREWAGSKIISRGRSYQRQKLVSDLAIFDEDSLIAWVEGTHRYATQVTIDDNGLPDSICTCPYGCNCKHGVAVLLEYLEHVKKNMRIPKADKDDERLSLFEEKEWDDDFDEDNDESFSIKTVNLEIDTYLKDKTKSQLIELIHELAGEFPQITQALTDRKQLALGDVKSLVKRLKKDICEISREPGWRNYWQGEGYTPDYSEVRIKLESLLEAGYADEVLTLGKDLVELGNRQIEESHDDGETAMAIEECVPVIIKSLDQSSMSKVDKLAWVVGVVQKDDYGIYDTFIDYLDRRHPKADWSILADRLLKQLDEMKNIEGDDDFHRNYVRDRLSNWVIHTLERAGREVEIIPLCEAEAVKTGSYPRLVNYLISAKQYSDAEHWIMEGIRVTEKKYPGIASDLRCKLKEIRISEKDWASVAVMQTEDFVHCPSRNTFIECKKAGKKTKKWPKIREHLLAYLEKGDLPWKQNGWPLPKPNLFTPEIPDRNPFPMVSVLIEIAILEKKPERILFWYDQLNTKGIWGGINENDVAKAIQDFAPERAVSIWKMLAESLINRTKPSAYEQAVGYLRKADKIMKREKKQTEWNQYLDELKEKQARKRRFIEILKQSDSRPIISQD